MIHSNLSLELAGYFWDDYEPSYLVALMVSDFVNIITPNPEAQRRLCSLHAIYRSTEQVL